MREGKTQIETEINKINFACSLFVCRCVCGFVCLALPASNLQFAHMLCLLLPQLLLLCCNFDAALLLPLLFCYCFCRNKCTLRGEVLSSVNWPQLFDMPASQPAAAAKSAIAKAIGKQQLPPEHEFQLAYSFLIRSTQNVAVPQMKNPAQHFLRSLKFCNKVVQHFFSLLLSS